MMELYYASFLWAPIVLGTVAACVCVLITIGGVHGKGTGVRRPDSGLAKGQG